MRHTAGNHRQQLLLRCGHEDFIQPVGSELSKQVPEEQEQDAAVEQIAPPLELTLA